MNFSNSKIPSGFKYPPDMRMHLETVFWGEYSIPLVKFTPTKDNPLRVLDIGANCGAFTRWLSDMYSFCQVDAYEPLQANCNLFRQNNPHATLHNVAVCTDKSPVKLYLGKNNSGENSLIKGAQQQDQFVEVPTLHPANLPLCDVLKLDIEGLELEVLLHYPYEPKVILVEAHTVADRHAIEKWLSKNFRLRHCFFNGYQFATLGFLHKSVKVAEDG